MQVVETSRTRGLERHVIIILLLLSGLVKHVARGAGDAQTERRL
jgi:hypothetical protein